MRIAYLISGNPKTYPACVDSFKSNIEPQNPHVYSHFWWDDSYRKKTWKLHFKEIIEDENLVEKIKNEFSLHRFVVEKNKLFDLSFFQTFNRNTWGENSEKFYRVMTPLFLYGILCQTYSINEASKLSSNQDYDVVVKSRPDLILTKNLIPILSSLDLSDNKIYFQSSLHGGHLFGGEFPNKPCDWFFVSNQKTMQIFLNSWHKSVSQKFIDGIMHTNELVTYVAESNQMIPYLVDFGAVIYKNATDYYQKYHIKFDEYLENFDFENFGVKNPGFWPYWTEMIDFSHFKNLPFQSE